MTVEQRLADALAGFQAHEPAPDLFARVSVSIAEDRAHRTRRRWTVLAVLGALAVAVGAGWASMSETEAGLVASGWWLEATVVATMAALVVSLAGVFRRVGGNFVAGSFPSSPPTGRNYLALLDIAYYLIFGGFTLASINLRNIAEPPLLPDALVGGKDRIGQLLLAMGMLHAVSFVSLPVVGLIYETSARRRQRSQHGRRLTDEPPDVQRAEWVVRGVLLGVGVLAALGAALAAGLILGGVDG